MSQLLQGARLARDLHVLLSAGMPVPEALAKAGHKASGRWAVGLRKAQQAAASGSTLAQALRSAGCFPKLLVEGMEAAPDQEPLLKISQLLESADWRQRQLRMVLSYPFLLLVAALLLVWLIYGLVGSAFNELFMGMSLSLPWITRVVLSVTRVIIHPLFITVEIAMIAGLYWVLSGADATAGLRLRLPLVGSWIRRSESATWLSWVDYFLSSGMPLPESMRRAAASCGDLAFRAKVEASAAAAERGQDLSKALGREQALPELGLWLVVRGEALELPAGYLAQVAVLLRREQDADSEGGLACLEVAGVLAMLFIVPPIIVGLFLPLYQLIGNLGG